MVTVREKTKFLWSDGQWYTCFNCPTHGQRTGETKTVGYHLADKYGVGFGTLQPTREAAQRLADKENARLAECEAIRLSYNAKSRE